MTKKDYILIARPFKQQIEVLGEDQLSAVINTAHLMAEELKQENPKFNRSLFLRACGLNF